MNHSRRYWAYLEALEPNYCALDQELRDAWRLVPDWIRSGEAAVWNSEAPETQTGSAELEPRPDPRHRVSLPNGRRTLAALPPVLLVAP